MPWTNRLVLADGLDVLRGLEAGSVDLVYADPPFCTGRRRGRGDGPSYPDRWEGGLGEYLSWMRERLDAAHRALAPTGSLFLHVDWRASHHLRVVLDEVFGADRFRNEIVWHYGLGGGAPRGAFSRKHDTLLFYARGRTNRFVRQRGEVTDAMERKYAHEDAQGRYMHAHGRRYYLKGGKPFDSVWDIPAIPPGAGERTGYPTQKPEALLERVVSAVTLPGDLVIDPFCGSGTTGAVALRLGRRFVGCDCSEVAVEVARARLERVAAAHEARFETHICGNLMLPASGEPGTTLAAAAGAR
jgi:site-specific DNA-methyltransferase (adenine-specific)/adenine-specific DNA-methyltransferase